MDRLKQQNQDKSIQEPDNDCDPPKYEEVNERSPTTLDQSQTSIYYNNTSEEKPPPTPAVFETVTPAELQNCRQSDQKSSVRQRIEAARRRREEIAKKKREHVSKIKSAKSQGDYAYIDPEARDLAEMEAYRKRKIEEKR